MYKGFDGAGLDGVKPVRKAQINGEDSMKLEKPWRPQAVSLSSEVC